MSLNVTNIQFANAEQAILLACQTAEFRAPSSKYGSYNRLQYYKLGGQVAARGRLLCEP